MRSTKQTVFVLAVTALLLVSSVGSVATVGAAPAGEDSAAAVGSLAQDDSLEPADEIYVKENGDAVLVYDTASPSASSSTTGHYGIDLSKGLMHMMVEDEMTGQTNVTGNGTLAMTPDSLSGEGDFQMPTPDSVEDLTFDASVTQNKQNAKASASFDGTFTSESGTVGQGTSMLESVSTEGTMTTTASTFTTSGSVDVAFEQKPGTLANQHHEFTLEETEDGYTLTAAQDYEVSQYSADAWSTRAKAKQQLEAQVGALTRQLDGEATVTIDSYSFDSSTYRLDIAYSVELTGVDEAISTQLASAMASSQQLDLSQSEAEELAQRIQKLEVSKVSATVDVTDTNAKASWDVELDQYDEAVTAMFDVAAASEMQDEDAEALEQARAAFEAQQAADLQQTVSWSGELTSPDQNSARLKFDANYETKNWGAFVSEMQSRTDKNFGSFTAEFHAETNDGQLETTMSAEMEQQDFLKSSVDSIIESAQGSEMDPQARKFLEAFKRSGFEKAKMDVSMQEGTVSMEAGASFENLSAFEDVMEEEYGDLSVTSAYGNLGEDGKTYVRLKGAVSEGASESEVRELAVVDSETTVHMPGDWNPDEKTFPEMDEEEVRDFVDVQANSGGVLGGMPGFGVGTAIAAVLGLSLVALRRHD
ncbi:hypothetical protein [Haloarchaeobius amylolyticus]|uniref:hypothetical protein n=1 Tax=Haloarchaeobius amylolyticus TaxID=1198296 RepID=UPI00227029A1|nr:hypothetical protein [Haloarchaeobius amylolyticus]